MSEPNESIPYLSADFGEQGGRYEWKTHSDATEWISQLQEIWSWVNKHNFQPTRSAYQTIANNLNSTNSSLQKVQSYRNQNQPQLADQQIASARTSLEEFIRKYPWLLPNTAQRRFIEELRDGGKHLEAALIVSNLMGQDLNGAPIRNVVDALLQWELYERGIKERMKTENATLKRLAGDMQTTLTRYQEAERTQTNRFDTLHTQISEKSSEQQTTFDDAQTNRAETWKLQLSTTQQELDNLKNTYDQHMALAAPVDYWETKRQKHHKLTLYSGAFIIFGMIAVGIFLTSEIQSISQALATANPSVLATLPPSQQSAAASSVQAASMMLTTATSASATWHLGSFLILALLCFWFIRLLVRIFLSNMHLENDAAERVTMAKTYLALIRSDNLPKGDNINTVLAALFRPTGDGIVKDEGVPPSTLEWFTKLGR